MKNPVSKKIVDKIYRYFATVDIFLPYGEKQTVAEMIDELIDDHIEAVVRSVVRGTQLEEKD